MIYIVQVDENRIPVTETGYQAINAAQYQNWYNGNGGMTILSMIGTNMKSIKHVLGDKMGNLPSDMITPVGTIEFTEAFLGKRVKPINVPSELNTKRFTGRGIKTGTKESIIQYMKENGLQRVFVKSNTRCKIITAGVVTEKELLNYPQDIYFYSEDISGLIESEWRIFVHRSQVLDCKMYIGDWYSKAPSKSVIENMVREYKDSPISYTLDVANILENGRLRTVVIEVHNFIACGLYGFNDARKLLGMLTSAYRWEQSH